MPPPININVESLRAQSSLATSQTKLQKSFQRLSGWYRINSATDGRPRSVSANAHEHEAEAPRSPNQQRYPRRRCRDSDVAIEVSRPARSTVLMARGHPSPRRKQAPQLALALLQ